MTFQFGFHYSNTELLKRSSHLIKSSDLRHSCSTVQRCQRWKEENFAESRPSTTAFHLPLQIHYHRSENVENLSLQYFCEIILYYLICEKEFFLGIPTQPYRLPGNTYSWYDTATSILFQQNHRLIILDQGIHF